MSTWLTVNDIDIRRRGQHNDGMQIDEAGLYQTVGTQLRARRRQLGKSQDWLAGRAGTTRTSITNIEAGTQRPPLHLLYALCWALGIEPTDLLPPTSAVLQPLGEEVTIGDTVRRLPPRTARFIKSVAQEPRRNER